MNDERTSSVRRGLKARDRISGSFQLSHRKMGQKILEAKNIILRFGGLEALNGLSFSVDPRRIVSIIGPNGAGKDNPSECDHRGLFSGFGGISLPGEADLPLKAAPDRGPGDSPDFSAVPTLFTI